MTDLKYKIISWVLIILSILLIVFSLFAPILIPQYFSGCDFCNSGVIGDSFGGMMGPFIAIAGVFTTLLAFIMQVKANEMQRDQFIKSIGKSYMDEKIDAYYKLEIIKVDIEDIIDDIKKRFEFLDTYINDVKKNPFATNRLNRTVNLSCERFLSEDRTLIYKGFKFFFYETENWITNYSSLYHIIEYLPELYKAVYQIGDSMNQTTFKEKIELREQLIEFEALCVDALNTNTGNSFNPQIYITSHASSILSDYLSQYRSTLESDKNKPEGDLLSILNILTKCKDRLESREVYSTNLSNLIGKCSSMIIKLNVLKNENENTLKEFNAVIKEKDIVLAKLEEINSFIKNGIKKISVEKLKKEYLAL